MTYAKNSVSSEDDPSARLNLVQILTVLAKYKKFIAGVTVGLAILAAGGSLLMPNMYRGTARLLPPQPNQSTAMAVLSQLGGVAGAAANVAGLKNPNDLYVGMLRSRTIADRIIDKFKLKSIYGSTFQEGARSELKGNTEITAGKDGLIVIEVLDRDPNLAMSLTNAYVSELLNLNKDLAVTEASQRRVFYERQLEAAKDNLANAEAALKSMMDKRGVISVDAESEAIVETVGRLKAQISAKEAELGSMKAFVTEMNPDYRRVAEEISSLRAQLAKLENGHQDDESISDKSTSSSKSGFESIKLLRNVKYYQMLYELLAKQYEVARLDEAKEPSIVQVLDPAIVPEMKAKPNRPLILLIGAFVGFFLAIIWAFTKEAFKKSQASLESREQWQELKSSLRIK